MLGTPQVFDDGPAGLLPVGEGSLPLGRPRLARLLDHHHPPVVRQVQGWSLGEKHATSLWDQDQSNRTQGILLPAPLSLNALTT